VLGTLAGLVVSVGVGAIFVLGERLSPTPRGAGPSWSGDDRRRAEIRDYLRAIGEPFSEDHDLRGTTVAFYLPARDVAITFDARAYYHIDGSPTHAVLVEHEMPGAHLGSRLPFETPTPPSADATDERLDPVARAFAVLGVSPAVSESELRDAYRRKIKEAHPDHGGSREAFRRVREAYATASENVTVSETTTARDTA
jgi:hypothetical protein